jgi:hypothetical protein
VIYVFAEDARKSQQLHVGSQLAIRKKWFVIVVILEQKVPLKL